MERVTHFELSCGNPEKTINFYNNTFGWQFSKWKNKNYWFIDTGPDEKEGINGGLMRRNDINQSLSNTIQVKDIDHSISKIEKFGGEIISSKSYIEQVGWIAYFKDPEGNIMGIMQPEKSTQ